jgi:hypothetical protein
MRSIILFCAAALCAAGALVAAGAPAPATAGTVVTAPAAMPPASSLACALGAADLDPGPAATATTTPATAQPGAPSLRSPAGTPRPFWALGGNCWGQFSACQNACGGNTLCDQGCECAYCTCADLLCPDYCGIGQN